MVSPTVSAAWPWWREREAITTAARLLGAADAQREAAGQVVVPWLQPFFDQVRKAVRAGLGEEAFARHVADGRGLPRTEAVALAVDGPLSIPLPTAP